MKAAKQLIRCNNCGEAVSTRGRNISGLCRNCYHYEYQKKKRAERVKNKCCANCGKKVKPIVIIRYRCEECLDKTKKKK